MVCSALDKAVRNKGSDALDSSTFRDFVEEDMSSFREVFASRFLVFVASRIHSAGEETTKATLLKLFGSPGVGEFFEYEAQMMTASVKEQERSSSSSWAEAIRC